MRTDNRIHPYHQHDLIARTRMSASNAGYDTCNEATENRMVLTIGLFQLAIAWSLSLRRIPAGFG